MPLKQQLLARNVFENYLYILETYLIETFGCLHIPFYPPLKRSTLLILVHK